MAYFVTRKSFPTRQNMDNALKIFFSQQVKHQTILEKSVPQRYLNILYINCVNNHQVQPIVFLNFGTHHTLTSITETTFTKHLHVTQQTRSIEAVGLTV